MKNFAFLIGFAIFVFILSKVNLPKAMEILSGIKVEFYFLSLALLVVMVLLKGLKWKLVLNSQQSDIGILKASKYFCIGFFFSSITPGRIGDFVRALYLKENNLSTSISSVLLDRVIDIILLVAFSAIASVVFTEVYGGSVISQQIILAMIFAVCVGLFFLFREKYLKIIFRPLFNLIVPENYKQRIAFGFNGIFLSVKKIFLRKKEFIFAVLVGAVFWVIAVVFSYFLAVSLGIVISLEAMFLLYPLILLADLLPISFSGVGTREAIVILFFSFISLSAEQAVAFSLLLFLTGYLLVALVGYIFFVSEPIDIKNSFAAK